MVSSRVGEDVCWKGHGENHLHAPFKSQNLVGWWKEDEGFSYNHGDCIAGRGAWRNCVIACLNEVITSRTEENYREDHPGFGIYYVLQSIVRSTRANI